ncbi:VWA domain-containing protein [uncultured Halopseudomonas sp.]|uniref:VWA domain-containing protein n=1 Tax=uncultured Halopseudomonas sp. TaxID=2901193 RepID=UPI0030EBE318|tara:strand:- start:28170 stop:30059 length:1890 start_codon:yes stop_codon:yes gene_type:complete
MQTEILDGLTLARPFWLLLLIPCLALSWLLYRRINHYSPWHSLLPAVMREALLQREPGKDHAGRFVLLASAWTLAIVALSGPVWEGESPVVRLNQSAVVVVLDLSHNMLANDLSPTRLERARLKIRDLLQIRSDSQIALVAYAGSAHRVTPLSSDQSTLINLLNGLSPDIMPVSGSNLGSALELAEQMVSPLPPDTTQILLITGSVEDTQLKALSEAAKRLGRQLSILGTGTAEGAPVALPEGGFMRDKQGRILLPRLDNQALVTIARGTGASYHDITRDDTDLLSLLQPLSLTSLSDPDSSASRSDQGHWLLLLLLPLAALGARRGWLGLMLCAMLLPTTADADSIIWQNLWQRPDQQAADLLVQDKPGAAAERFEDPHWAAWALYQAGDYTGAADAYEQLVQQDPDNPQHHFNHGTALAMGGELQDALEAYEQTLTRAPDHAAARHNRSRIEALIEEQARQAEQQEANTESDGSEAQAGETITDQEDQGSGSTPSPEDATRADYQSQQPSPPSGPTSPPVDNPPASAESNDNSETMTGSGSDTRAGTRVEALDDDQTPRATATMNGEMPAVSSDQLAPLPDAPQKVLEPEQEAALQQWLREVPDNPTDLLRRKFLYQRLQQLEERSR